MRNVWPGLIAFVSETSEALTSSLPWYCCADARKGKRAMLHIVHPPRAINHPRVCMKVFIAFSKTQSVLSIIFFPEISIIRLEMECLPSPQKSRAEPKGDVAPPVYCAECRKTLAQCMHLKRALKTGNL